MGKRDVDVTVVGKNKAKPGLNDAGRDVDSFGSRIGKLISPLTLLKAAIAGLGIAALGRLFSASVKSASESAAAWGRVESAVTNAGISFAFVRGNLDRLFLSIQKTTRFSDDAAADAFTELLTISNDYGKSVSSLGVVLDLAAAKQIDLKTAAQLVGRAMIGETGTLSRYGILVEKGADAVAVMSERFRGFAERDAKTMQGQLVRVANAWDNVKESIGGALLGFDTTEAGASRLVATLETMSTWIEENKKTFADFGDSLGRIAGFYQRMAALRDAGAPKEFLEEMNRTTDRLAEGRYRAEDPLAERNEIFAARQIAANAARENPYESPITAAQRKAQEKAFEGLTADTAGDLYAATRGRSAIGALGEVPTLEPISEGMAPALDPGQVEPMIGALGELRDVVTDIGQNTVTNFASTWSSAIVDIVSGSRHAGIAIEQAFKKATGGALMAEGQKWILEAGAIAIKGAFNPGEWARAAALFTKGTAALALGSAFANGTGGGGGGGAGMSSAGFQQSRQEIRDGRGTGTINVIGGLLNMSDPRQRDAFADAIQELTGLRIIFTGGDPT